MREFAEPLYKSVAWQKCRAAYASSVGGLCERCLEKGLYKAGVIVHHKVYLTPDNINDPTVALSFDNLELLCRDCHAAEHQRTKLRYTIDEFGRVICSPERDRADEAE